MRPQRIHNLHHNKAEHSPARWLFFDTETRPQEQPGGELHTLRLWAAQLVERDGPVRAAPRCTAWTGTTADQLADATEDACRSGETLWVCAHNLAFDLVVTRLPLLLLERGWVITQHAITGGSPWLRLRRGRRGITMVDSLSWLPVSAQLLTTAVGIDKPPLPDWHDDDAAWVARCRADVAILAAAMGQLLDWWDRRRLGHWSLTGPGTGMNAYRHKGFRQPVVIDPDPAARAQERRAIYAGRAEAWRVGVQPVGLYAVVDFAHAFGSVCATQWLPRRRGRAFDSLPLDSRMIDSRMAGVLAECEVETRTPRYPLRTARGIVHPVGRFVTTLCGPELVDARRRGELRAIGPGHVYLTSPHMTTWGRWALDIIDGRDEDAPPTAQVAVKAWTRTVPGRWAGRTSRVALTLPQVAPGWRVEHGRHTPSGAGAAVLDLGGTRYWLVSDQDQDHAFPAVLAWIQAHVRVRLGMLVDRLGAGAVVSCNTDGALVDVQAWRRSLSPVDPRRIGAPVLVASLEEWLRDQGDYLAPLVPRVKSTHRRVEVLSPQHAILDADRQLSGVPRGAVDLGGHRYSFTDWPRMATQLEAGDPRGYVRRQRTVDLSRVPVLRWVLADGSTAPVEAAGTLGGPSTLLPWSPGRVGPHSAVLATVQHPILAPLVAPLTEVA